MGKCKICLGNKEVVRPNRTTGCEFGTGWAHRNSGVGGILTHCRGLEYYQVEGYLFMQGNNVIKSVP